ncbi:MAG: pyridoxamine 5'-phosphate oxidase [Acidobacteriota bacterium]
MPSEPSIESLRREYEAPPLRRSGLKPDPFDQFSAWFEDAVRDGVPEPNAMVLATADAEGRPSARYVLLKGFDHRGFVFFTNYSSPKAQALEANPRAELLFYWERLGRQVRIAGIASRTSREVSEAYFAERPRRSRLAALISRQSMTCPSREDLERRLAAAEREWEGREPPCPENWGGIVVSPEVFEFWQGRPDRLHDRFRYTRTGEGWQIHRLDP